MVTLLWTWDTGYLRILCLTKHQFNFSCLYSILQHLYTNIFTSVHDKSKMCQSPPFYSVMLDILRPDGALNVHQNPGFWTLQLNHHYGAEVASLVSVRVVVAGESSEWGVGHLKVKNISVYFISGYQ